MKFNLSMTCNNLKIKSLQKEAGTWIYIVEMSMGSEPDFGRLGAETTVVLEEQDIRKRQIDAN